MSAIATALSKQMYGNSFDFLHEILGADLVNSIPCVTVNHDGDYPKPWKTAADLPADVVKGLLPSGRPFLAMRYVITQIDKVGYEFFFQRYSDKYPAVTRITTAFGEVIEDPLKIETDSKEKAEVFSKHWSSGDYGCNGYGIYDGGGMNEKHYAIIKSILEGEPLNKTGGRYLQLYAMRFKQEKA